MVNRWHVYFSGTFLTLCVVLLLIAFNDSGTSTSSVPIAYKQTAHLSATDATHDFVALPASTTPTPSGVVGQEGGAVLSSVAIGNHVFMAAGQRIQVMDSTVVTQLVIIGKTTMLPDIVYDTALAGDRLYLANGARGGVQIIDVSDPTTPMVIGKADSPGHAQGVFVSGNTLYLADGTTGLRLFDVSNPSSPSSIGFVATPGYANDVVVVGTIAYVADGNGGIQVINVATPSQPVLLPAVAVGGEAAGLFSEGNYLFVAAGANGLRILSISNPSVPVEIGFVSTPGTAFDVYVSEDVAYVANGWEGIRIIDVRNPQVPVEVSSYKPGGYAVAVFVSERVAYLSAREAGLHLINVSNPLKPARYSYHDLLTDVKDIAISGENAFVADAVGGLRVLHLTDPVAPQLQGALNTPGITSRVYVSGDIVFIADEWGGARIVDVSELSQPQEISAIGAAGPVRDLYPLGKLLFIVDATGVLQIYDIANPALPTKRGQIQLPHPAFGVFVVGNQAFVADGIGGLRVIDVSNPQQPVEVGFYDTPGNAYKVEVVGNLAFVADGTTGLLILDVSDPTEIVQRGAYDTSNLAQGVHIIDTTAYVGDTLAGVTVIDVADPTNPQLIRVLDTAGHALNAELANNLLYVADGMGGIYVFGDAECRRLQLTHSGEGTDPSPAPEHSVDCPLQHYRAGEEIVLTAAPASGWEVNQWSGTVSDTITGTINTVVMPVTAHTASVVYSPIPEIVYGDPFEDDDTCTTARTIAVGGEGQTHTFHAEDDVDWLVFPVEATHAYVLEVNNIGPNTDAVIALYDSCAKAPQQVERNSFGSNVIVAFSTSSNGDYYVQLRQFDPSFFGDDVSYKVSISRDLTPPSAPAETRCVAIDDTTIGLQWNRSPESDVKLYRISYGKVNAGESFSKDVNGVNDTYLELGSLTPNTAYRFQIKALDQGLNESPPSGEVQCMARLPQGDSTTPQIIIQQPNATSTYTTTNSRITVRGLVSDTGGNLSRVQIINETNGSVKWDYSLTGNSAHFAIEDLPLARGSNILKVKAFDQANNSTETSLTVNRDADTPGAVVIVAGQNDTYSLQTNIYNATNRAFRIFLSAGFNKEDIYYLAPVPQDADKDGETDSVSMFSPAEIEYAITQWAKSRVGPGQPLFLYLMDHGETDEFCATGCGVAHVVTSDKLDSWLSVLESATGVDAVNVVYEACRSGSFIQRNGALGSISKAGRVIITSAGVQNNAYASAEGAYFSDTFFSCIADSGSLKACFEEGRVAVQAAKLLQTPMLDDNGDGVYDASDGTIATNRYVTRFFGSMRPTITGAQVTTVESNGILTATVESGAEEVNLVWAAVFPPDFVEPDNVTLNLNVPIVRLGAVAGTPNLYQADYPNGFSQTGEYRIIFYAQDRLGINALPLPWQDNPVEIYLPILVR